MKNVNQIRTGNSLELFKIKNPDYFKKKIRVWFVKKMVYFSVIVIVAFPVRLSFAFQ